MTMNSLSAYLSREPQPQTMANLLRESGNLMLGDKT
jgi:hypothetical protein